MYNEPEFYTEENLITEVKEQETETERIILQSPLEEEETWESGDQRREIVATEKIVSTPVGEFHGVLKVRIEYLEQENGFTTYEYYAPNIGLIKRENIGEDDYKILAELEWLGMEREDREDSVN